MTGSMELVTPAFRVRKETKRIILHASHTAPRCGEGEWFYRWLYSRGREMGLLQCGYHVAIDADGRARDCRPHTTIGNHCHRNNEDSIGIVLEGGLLGMAPGDKATDPPVPLYGDTFTEDQRQTLIAVVLLMRTLYEIEDLPVVTHSPGVIPPKYHGHLCPNFKDQDRWTTPGLLL